MLIARTADEFVGITAALAGRTRAASCSLFTTTITFLSLLLFSLLARSARRPPHEPWFPRAKLEDLFVFHLFVLRQIVSRKFSRAGSAPKPEALNPQPYSPSRISPSTTPVAARHGSPQGSLPSLSLCIVCACVCVRHGVAFLLSLSSVCV